MRILHLADRWTDRGGAYWHLAGILDHQARTHEVSLAVGRDDAAMPAVVPVRRIPGLEARAREKVVLTPVLEELRPDVVHLHNVVNPEALERVASLPGVAKVVTVQDHRFFCPTRGKWTTAGRVCRDAMTPAVCAECFTDERYFWEVYTLTEERLRALQRFRVVVLSRYMKSELVAAGIDEKRIDVVPPFVHGVDLDARAHGPPCVLFAGRLVAAKGPLDAVQAWRQSETGLPLVVAGAGPLREEIQERGIEALGWVPHDRMAGLFRRAACLVMSSRWQEPFGIAGLEALSLRTPVAAWESGGIAEWHPGPLARWGDVESLAGEIRSAIGRRVEAPPGFERDVLMRRLEEAYQVD